MSYRKNIYIIFSEEEIYYLAKYVKKTNSKAEMISEVSNSDLYEAQNLKVSKQKIIQKVQLLQRNDFFDLISYIENLKSISV